MVSMQEAGLEGEGKTIRDAKVLGSVKRGSVHFDIERDRPEKVYIVSVVWDVRGSFVWGVAVKGGDGKDCRQWLLQDWRVQGCGAW